MTEDRRRAEGPEPDDELTRVTTEGAAGADEQTTDLKLPGFRMIRELGRGGMGRVVLARQIEPVEREVAIKLVHRKLRGAAGEARFLIERQALAQMHHPAIAQIFEAGTNGDGFPYFAMEYVPGQPLQEFCDQRHIGLNERLELFIRICRGVAHAHQKGIIHRDLKPANLLVTAIDGVPSPKIIDFGISTAVAESVEQGAETSTGTPMYMSPEQFDPARGIDIRADVYSLGVVLCELLCGLRPGPRGLRPSATDSASARNVDDSDDRRPRRPSALFRPAGELQTELAAARGTTPARLQRQLTGALDAIATRAMHPDPEMRYDNSLELAQDVSRYLKHEPVQALPAHPGYRLRCFVSRHAWSVASASMILLALGAGLALALTGLNEARHQQALAETRSEELARVVGFQQSMLGDLEPQLLGDGFVRRLRAQYRQSLEPTVGAADLQIGLNAFEFAVARINPTDLAQDLIDEFMLQRALESIEEEFSDQPRLQADLYETVRNVYDNAGMIERSLPLAHRVVALRVEALGPDATQTLKARQHLYRLLNRSGDYPAARDELDRIFARMQPDRPDQIELRHDTWDSLANLQVNTGNNDEALQTALSNLERAERELGLHHASTARALNTLGYVHALSGRLEPALDYFEQSLARARGHFDPEEVTYYSPLINVGAALSALGRLEESLPYQREAYEILSAEHGHRNDSTLRAMTNLAATLNDLGRFEEAVALQERALAMGRDGWGPHSPITLSIQQNLAGTLLNAHQPERAAGLLESVVDWRSRTLAPGEGDLIQSLEMLVEALNETGRHAQALKRAQSMHEALQQREPPDRQALVDSVLRVADTLQAMNRPEEELRWRQQLLEGPDPIESHPAGLASHLRMLELHLQAGQVASAQELARQLAPRFDPDRDPAAPPEIQTRWTRLREKLPQAAGPN